MSKSLFVYTAILLLLVSCKKDTTNDINNVSSNNTGAVTISFDKSQTPENVRYLRAVLKNSTDSVWTVLDIDSGNTATISFAKVKIGNWLLRIDAMSHNLSLLFTGSSSVIVEEDKITEVNLVLQPVNSGIGGVKIYITWGVGKTEWKDYAGNPILKYPLGDSLSAGVQHPRIVFFKDRYVMAYKFNVSAGGIGIAYSSNAVQWDQISQTPLIKVGQSGKWDDKLIQTGALTVIEGKLYCYYVGNGYSDGRSKIGLAISSDGETWEKIPNPVLENIPGQEESIGASDICRVGNMYYLYYYSHKYINGYWDATIHLAMSSDGIQWTRYQNNPIIVANKQLEYQGVYYASVIFDNGIYRMAYMNRNVYDYSKTSFFTSTSTDGINWTKDSDTPIFTVAQTANNWAKGSIEYPFLRKFGNEYRIYYCSFYEGYKAHIGFAYKQNSLD